VKVNKTQAKPEVLLVGFGRKWMVAFFRVEMPYGRTKADQEKLALVYQGGRITYLNLQIFLNKRNIREKIIIKF
jgi:hypothetical protein